MAKSHYDNSQVEALADKVFTQAAKGNAVQLSPEHAEILGAFEEDALSVEDIVADAALTNGNGQTVEDTDG